MISKDMYKVYGKQNDIECVTMYSKKYYKVSYCNETGVGTIKANGQDKVICVVYPKCIDSTMEVFQQV